MTREARSVRVAMRRALVVSSLMLPLLAPGAARAVGAEDALNGAIAIKSQEAVAYVPAVAVTSPVPWAGNPIRVDGDLAEWKRNGAAPAVVLAGEKHASWFKGAYGGKDDLAAALWLCRDDRCIYLALEIADDRPPAPERINFAFADANSRLITTWQDVGMRVGADDVGALFILGKDDSVRMHWWHIQRRMDYSMVQNSFGTETERRAFLEEGGAKTEFGAKIFSKMSRRLEGAKSVTEFEAAFPWKSLAPYDPVSYAPVKFNLAVEDKDDDEKGLSFGAVGWMPGLVEVYSAAHFVNLAFEPPVGRQGVDTYAQVPAFNYINQNIVATFSFYNHAAAARGGKLELLVRPAGGAPLAEANITLPPGLSRQTLTVHSEKLDVDKCGFLGHLTLEGQPALDIPVHVPRLDDTVTVQRLAVLEAKIAQLEKNAAALSDLYQRIEAKGLDTAYPLAYLTLQQMFIPRCRMDLGAGDSARVLRNTAYLEKMFESSKAYLEAILKDPAAQLKVPPRFKPDTLETKNGYYFAGGKPVFLWGPCVFWYLRQDQPLVGKLGFNSVCPELPLDPSNKDAVAHMEGWYRMGLPVNAAMHVPDLQLTGRDVRASKLLKEHPDIANLDQNNFLPFLVQHPIARQTIAEGFRKSIAFWHNFPGVRSYWLWNEPWYLNYSERTRQDFIEQYLTPRYQAVEALNKRWKSAYKSFDEVKLITWPDPKNYAPWYDFQQFRDELLADFFDFLSNTAKGIDPSRPTHTKFMAASLHAFSIERFQSSYDIAGHDGSNNDRDILFLDFCRSLYPDHPLVNTEVHIAYGGRRAVDLVAWRLALHGLADGNWWCWHSNASFSDSIGNAESMYALTISGLDLQRLFDPHIYALNQKAMPVATLFPDVVERRSDLSMVRRRFELATAQYYLGLQPFYATETRVAQGELAKHKLLLAGESDYVKDSTYKGVLDYVENGGKAIVVKGGFAHNEYGDPRDASELIRPEGGESYGEGARVYPLGKGQVICLDAVPNLLDVVLDGGQVMRGGPLAEQRERQRVYQRVLAKAMADNGIQDPVRLVAADASKDDPDALYGLDWRSVEVDGGHTLAVVPYGAKAPFGVKLATAKPVRKIVNLITGQEAPLEAFALENGPNLFRIELER